MQSTLINSYPRNGQVVEVGWNADGKVPYRRSGHALSIESMWYKCASSVAVNTSSE